MSCRVLARPISSGAMVCHGRAAGFGRLWRQRRWQGGGEAMCTTALGHWMSAFAFLALQSSRT